MSHSMPQSMPGGLRQGNVAASGGPSIPSKTQQADCGCSGGKQAARMSRGSASAASGSAPSLRPASAGDGIGGQWHASKRIAATWCINEVRNAWVYVDAVGWRKLSNGLDSAIDALSLLGGQALISGASVDLREEADGMIHEMYVW